MVSNYLKERRYLKIKKDFKVCYINFPLWAWDQVKGLGGMTYLNKKRI